MIIYKKLMKKFFSFEQFITNMSKIKGSNAERELLRMFWASSWACIRSAGSGSMHFPSPDLLAANKIRRLAIEVKAQEIFSNRRDKAT
jgi:Holliday junction resolvase